MSPLLDAILSGVGYVGEALDAPGAYLRGALAGDLGERRSGREMLEAWGLLGENEEGLDFGDVAGFGADVIFDPLNAISGGTLGAMKVANKGIDAANAGSRAMRAAGAMPEEVAKLTKVLDETGNPLRMYHGTPHAFDKPDFGRLDPNALMGKGWYATDSPKISSSYTTKGGVAHLATDDDSVSEEIGRRLTRMIRGDPENANLNGIAEVTSRMAGSSNWDEIHEAATDLGLHVDDLITPSPRNVRMQYLDIRNPFDADASLDPQEGLSLLRQALGDATGDPRAVSALANAEFAAKRGIPVQGVDIIEALKRSGVVPGEALRGAGYDGITHTGGVRMGNDRHRVFVATDPSQIYSPYVAPALQDRKDISPVLAAMIGNTALQAPYDTRRNP